MEEAHWEVSKIQPQIKEKQVIPDPGHLQQQQTQRACTVAESQGKNEHLSV